MMNVEAIQEATKGLEKVTKKVSGYIYPKYIFLNIFLNM